VLAGAVPPGLPNVLASRASTRFEFQLRYGALMGGSYAWLYIGSLAFGLGAAAKLNDPFLIQEQRD
jgi:hypothetical protein